MKTLKEVYFETFTANCLKAVELTKAKNEDYSSGNDPYRNFRLTTHISGVPLAKGILVRVSDKLARINNLLDRPGMEGAVVDEKITDTVFDLMVYSNILLTWLQLGEPAVDTEYRDEEPEVIMTAKSSLEGRAVQTIDSVNNKIKDLFKWK
jgi:hypothetical protein